MIRQDDVGRETLEGGGKCLDGIDSLDDGLHAGAVQLVRYELRISLAVFEQKNAERFVRRAGCASHYEYFRDGVSGPSLSVE